VNLPVNNLNKSVEFFTNLGIKFNPQFTDVTATCMIVTEDIFVMLLTEAKFQTFVPKGICDATKSTEVLVCLSSEGREKVDEMVRKGVVLSDRQVVEQGSESHLLPFACCLAHASGQRNLGHAVEDSRPSGSLLPSRGAFSSPASYRFIPAPKIPTFRIVASLRIRPPICQTPFRP
jgi:predicted lactoylglutathione lyase